jgi:hypothetical protein
MDLAVSLVAEANYSNNVAALVVQCKAASVNISDNPLKSEPIPANVSAAERRASGSERSRSLIISYALV